MTPPNWGRAIRAGAAGAAAYLLAQELDRRIVPNGYDDLVLWGGFATSNPRGQRAIGAIVHLTLAIVLAAAYGTAGPLLPRLPGPVRGLLFAQMENAVLYPGVPLLNRIHPAVRRGELPSLLTWRYFWVEVWRHAAYGVVVGGWGRES